ncbi:MAG: hypothetical protein E4H11_09925 [Myxococcales bacterium]|nr:MAG: hypothetical protein E4H11_09925 [Myxococcales bacterium]
MRRVFVVALALVLVAGLAGSSAAARLNWEGTLTSTTGELPPLHLTGGGVATVNGSSGTVPAHLETLRLEASRGGIEGTDTNIITDPEVAGNGIAAIILMGQGGTGTLGPISGALGSQSALTQRVLPARGLSKICLLSTLCTDFLPLLLTQPTTNGARYQVNTATPNQLTPNALQGKRLGVPGTGVKGVGIGGLITVGGDSPIRISLEAAPWTVKTATAIDQTDDNTGVAAFHDVTRMGFAHGPASGTTSTAQPSGVLQLVTPSQVRTNLALGSNVKISVLTELLIHFIPEPGLMLLLGSGVVGLALIGRSRMKK